MNLEHVKGLTCVAIVLTFFDMDHDLTFKFLGSLSNWSQIVTSASKTFILIFSLPIRYYCGLWGVRKP